MTIQVKLLECKKCNWKWYPRLRHLEKAQEDKIKLPKICPKCKCRNYLNYEKPTS